MYFPEADFTKRKNYLKRFSAWLTPLTRVQSSLNKYLVGNFQSRLLILLLWNTSERKRSRRTLAILKSRMEWKVSGQCNSIHNFTEIEVKSKFKCSERSDAGKCSTGEFANQTLFSFPRIKLYLIASKSFWIKFLYFSPQHFPSDCRYEPSFYRALIVCRCYLYSQFDDCFGRSPRDARMQDDKSILPHIRHNKVFKIPVILTTTFHLLSVHSDMIYWTPQKKLKRNLTWDGAVWFPFLSHVSCRVMRCVPIGSSIALFKTSLRPRDKGGHVGSGSVVTGRGHGSNRNLAPLGYTLQKIKSNWSCFFYMY